jgi:hypothetical protein
VFNDLSEQIILWKNHSHSKARSLLSPEAAAGWGFGFKDERLKELEG